jgi:hypothetical protein
MLDIVFVCAFCDKEYSKKIQSGIQNLKEILKFRKEKQTNTRAHLVFFAPFFLNPFFNLFIGLC